MKLALLPEEQIQKLKRNIKKGTRRVANVIQ